MDRELLIEIGVEELPAGWMPRLTRQLAEHVGARLTELRIACPVRRSRASARRAGSPPASARLPSARRICDETITGPPVSAAFGADGKPTPGGARVREEAGRGVRRADPRHDRRRASTSPYHKRHRGKSAVDALPELLGGVLRDLAFPKQMHWDAKLDDGRGELLFGRPIRWLLFLYGGRVVPFTIGRTPGAAGAQVQDVETGALTYGHRFLATSGRAGRSIKVRSFDEYRARLAEHFVVLEHTERRDRIARELEAHARRLGGRVQLQASTRRCSRRSPTWSSIPASSPASSIAASSRCRRKC